MHQTNAQSRKMEQDRERIYARQQFARSFRDLQLLGQGLLKDHKAGNLTPSRLEKDTRSIRKHARNLRQLMALGDLAIETEIEKEVSTPEQFDKSIRRLSSLIWEFAHNPIHQNSKVFNTDQAERAQTDLLTIINLSRLIEDKAKSYIFLPVSAQ